LERRSRYWLVAVAGKKEAVLFTKATAQAWQWVKDCRFIRWFTDGEKCYAQQLWKIASCYLKVSEFSQAYGYRKVWRQGLEVAIKIKASQGNRGVKWLKPEHLYTAISHGSEVHANHNEAHNSALRRRCSTYRRRQSHYAKDVEGRERALSVQRLAYN